MFFNETLKEIVGEPALRALVVKADPFSLDALIAWLEKQQAGETYCYTSEGNCLWGRYVAAHGGHLVGPGEDGYQIGSAHFRNDYCFRIREPRYALAVRGPWTFGAALQRARALRDAS